MKKIILLQSLLWFSLGLKACKETEESYWVADGITKENGEAMTGVTLIFMEALAEKKIHLRKHGDLLLFVYPMTKEVTEAELKSITDLRVAETGQLIDSVYKVVVSDKSLHIKFHYIGTGKDDKRFSLNFARVEKHTFDQEVAALQKERQQITGKLKTTEVKALDLSIPLPDYFNEKDLTALSPMQGVDLLFGVKSTEVQSTFNSFDLEDSTGKKEKYTKLGIDIPGKDQPAARFDDIAFSGLEFIRSESNKTQAITLYGPLDKNKLQELCERIAKSRPKAFVTFTGLPNMFMGEIQEVMEWFSISWKDDDCVIKLQVKTPEAIYKQRVYKDLYLREKFTDADIKTIFTQYAGLSDSSFMRLFLLDNDFEAALWEGKNDSRAGFEDYMR